MTSEADADACAVALQAAAVLKKPFAAHALLEAVRTTLREHRATAETSRHARTHSSLINSETIVLKLPGTGDGTAVAPSGEVSAVVKAG
jgi:DNA-binding response OmpR family regulator